MKLTKTLLTLYPEEFEQAVLEYLRKYHNLNDDRLSTCYAELDDGKRVTTKLFTYVIPLDPDVDYFLKEGGK